MKKESLIYTMKFDGEYERNIGPLARKYCCPVIVWKYDECRVVRGSMRISENELKAAVFSSGKEEVSGQEGEQKMPLMTFYKLFKTRQKNTSLTFSWNCGGIR